jgi:hypothetical protein
MDHDVIVNILSDSQVADQVSDIAEALSELDRDGRLAGKRAWSYQEQAAFIVARQSGEM